MPGLRSRLTYANVVATIALFLALGGTSYAAVRITGKNVKNGSLTGADIKSNSVTGANIKSLTVKDFKAGQLPAGSSGSDGAQGSTGARGPQGIPGLTGTTGVANVVVRTTTANLAGGTTTTTRNSVACHSGERAVSGGVTFRNAQNTQDRGSTQFMQVTTSHPASGIYGDTPATEGQTPNGWTTGVHVLSPESSDVAVFYAVCVSP